MNPNKALREKGNFTRIAASMRESGEAIVKAIGITQGLTVSITPVHVVRGRIQALLRTHDERVRCRGEEWTGG